MSMNIKNNIVNYLFDRDYVISIYDNYIYIFNYKYLDGFNENNIKIKLVDRDLIIKGTNLSIVKITKEEVLIKGKIEKIEMIYDNERSH